MSERASERERERERECVCVCVYVGIYIYIYTYMFVCVCVCVSVCERIHYFCFYSCDYDDIVVISIIRSSTCYCKLYASIISIFVRRRIAINISLTLFFLLS